MIKDLNSIISLKKRINIMTPKYEIVLTVAVLPGMVCNFLIVYFYRHFCFMLIYNLSCSLFENVPPNGERVGLMKYFIIV